MDDGSFPKQTEEIMQEIRVSEPFVAFRFTFYFLPLNSYEILHRLPSPSKISSASKLKYLYLFFFGIF